MLKALIQSVTLFEQNASILYCDETNKCAIVDPGGDIEVLLIDTFFIAGGSPS